MTKKVPVNGGVREAAKMLQGLSAQEQERILQQMAQKDPQMAASIRHHMVVFDDLRYLTATQMMELLRDVEVADLALALRMAAPELRDHFVGAGRLTSRLRKDIEEVLLGPPQALAEVEKARDRVMEVVRDKVKKGQIVLRDDDSEEYV